MDPKQQQQEEKEELIGSYRVHSLLATGQDSQVFEVVEPVIGRHFAIKRLLPEAARSSECRQMMFHEAEVGISMGHPNVIRIMKVNKEDKQPYFVMEYFPAGSMKQRIMHKKTEFIKAHATGIFKQIATALAYMNFSNWVHRDVKPDNILVSSSGDAKLIDFALAKRIKKTNFLMKWLMPKGKTQGTRSYISPEQIRNLDLDGRADMYSFAASFYEIVTLRPPFRGASPQDLLAKHLTEKVVPPHTHNPDVTEEFSRLLVKMLSKRKEDRPANFHEVMQQFQTMRIFKSMAPPPKAEEE